MMAQKAVNDTLIVMTRELRPVLRDPFSLAFNLVQPLVFLGLFGPLLGDMFVDEGTSMQWFVPGILVMLTLFGTGATGYNMLTEMQTGSHERMLVTPLSRSSLLSGRALKEFVPLLAQAVLIILVMIPFGFRLEPAGALLGLLILGVFGVGLGALSYALALAVRKQEWIFWGVQQSLMFPLMILSGVLLPVDFGPDWIQTASRLNPLTYVVDAERRLFAGEIMNTEVLYGALSAVITLVLGLWLGIRMFRRAAI